MQKFTKSTCLFKKLQGLFDLCGTAQRSFHIPCNPFVEWVRVSELFYNYFPQLFFLCATTSGMLSLRQNCARMHRLGEKAAGIGFRNINCRVEPALSHEQKMSA